MRAVSADALLPVAEHAATTTLDRMPSMMLTLWETLQQLDDITASTSAILNLLAKLHSLLPSSILDATGGSTSALADLVPRLWPFMSHTSSGVRLSTLSCLHSLLRNPSSPTEGGQPQGASAEFGWLVVVLADLTRFVLQILLLDDVDAVRARASEVWDQIPRLLSTDQLRAATADHLAAWLELASTPPTVPVNPSLLLHPATNAPAPTSRTVAIAGRVAAATALGVLAYHWPQSDFEGEWSSALTAMLSHDSAVRRHVGALVCSSLAVAGGAGGGNGVAASVVERLKAMVADVDGNHIDYSESARVAKQWRTDLRTLHQLCASLADRKGPLLPTLAALVEPTPLQTALELLSGTCGYGGLTVRTQSAMQSLYIQRLHRD